MKKIYLLLAVAIGLVSCNMDKEPYNSLPDTEALQKVTDFSNARISLYSGLRSCMAGDSHINAPEIQSDEFNAVAGFSNTLGDMYRWDFTTEGSYFSTVYSNYQTMIARANYIIGGYNSLDLSQFDDDDLATLKTVKGDAFFVRAYCIFMLSQYFCADYEESTAGNANSGVSYRLDYAPSSDASTYPARYTLKETFDQVKADLDSADVFVTAEGAPCYQYVSVDAVTALRARVALAMDDYSTAATQAVKLIDGGAYALAEGEDELEELWQNDAGLETIFQLVVASRDELPSANGDIYQPYSDGAVPDYIPTQTVIDLYSANDYRFSVYFNTQEITTSAGQSGTVYAFNKYIDHGRLYTEFSGYEYARFVIEPKVFRIAEMYLIAAEAYAKNGNVEQAAKYLNELEAARIENYTDRSFTSTTIMTEIQNERQREMIGEASRLFDIKRWHIGLTRGTPQNLNLCNLPGNSNTTALTRSADENKLTWPIPKHETDVNKKVVQNPGY